MDKDWLFGERTMDIRYGYKENFQLPKNKYLSAVCRFMDYYVYIDTLDHFDPALD